MKTLLVVLTMLLCAECQAQSPRDIAIARRRVEVQRHNHAQAEAQRMVAQGLGTLSRPADPWNRNRGRYNGSRYSGIHANTTNYNYPPYYGHRYGIHSNTTNYYNPYSGHGYGIHSNTTNYYNPYSGHGYGIHSNTTNYHRIR